MLLISLLAVSVPAILPADQIVVDAGTRTITEVATTAKPGDTVLLAAGIHAGGGTIACSGTREKPIVFHSAPGARIQGRIELLKGIVKVKAGTDIWSAHVPGPFVAVGRDLGTTPLILENALRKVSNSDALSEKPWQWFMDEAERRLMIHLPPGQKPHLYLLRDSFGLAVSGSNLVFENFTIDGFANAGMRLAGGQNVTVRHCRISRCGYQWSAGIHAHKTHFLQITNCRFIRVMNAFILNSADRTSFSHNSICLTRAHGILLYHARDTSIRNNILYAGGPSGSAIYAGPEATDGLELDHNCYYNCGGNTLTWMPRKRRFSTFWEWRRTAGFRDRRSFSKNPQFRSIDYGREDLRLKLSSPCRGMADDGGDLGARIPD